MVEHANFFSQSKRIVSRQHVDKRAESNPLRALGSGGQKKIRRRRHVEGRAVMLGDMITVETILIASFDELQALLVEFVDWQPIARSNRKFQILSARETPSQIITEQQAIHVPSVLSHRM